MLELSSFVVVNILLLEIHLVHLHDLCQLGSTWCPLARSILAS